MFIHCQAKDHIATTGSAGMDKAQHYGGSSVIANTDADLGAQNAPAWVGEAHTILPRVAKLHVVNDEIRGRGRGIRGGVNRGAVLGPRVDDSKAGGSDGQ